MNKPADKPLIISNMSLGDVTFDSDAGSWNVTRAIRDCALGKHKIYAFDVAEVISNTAAVETDEAKLAAMAADRKRLSLSPPLIFAVEQGCASG
jgi:hypothetical protein